MLAPLGSAYARGQPPSIGGGAASPCDRRSSGIPGGGDRADLVVFPDISRAFRAAGSLQQRRQTRLRATKGTPVMQMRVLAGLAALVLTSTLAMAQDVTYDF